jgi:cyclohexadienyl dehydratase
MSAFGSIITASPQGSRSRWRRLLESLSICAWLIVAGADCSHAGGDAVVERGVVLRIGTSGDYRPFSFAAASQPEGLDGFDLAVARAYARDRGYRIRWLRFRWPDLMSEFRAGRFDLVMSGLTVRPERSAAGRFTVPVVRSGAVVLVRDSAAPAELGDLDDPTVRIAVNAGGHLEQVARSRFPRAKIQAIPDNSRVMEALREGRARAAVTDTLEAPHWRAPGPRLLGPFTRDWKAYLVQPELGELAADLDAWLGARERDGTLAALRREYLGGDRSPPVAEAIPALLAAIDERMALMPQVAEAKRRAGIPVEVPEVEMSVLAAGQAAVERAAAELGIAAPEPDRVAALFRALIEAAKKIQREVLSGPPQLGAGLDLRREIRPALLRIGDRIARLVVLLPGKGAGAHAGPDPDFGDPVASIEEELGDRRLDPAHRRAIAEAIRGLTDPGSEDPR